MPEEGEEDRLEMVTATGSMLDATEVDVPPDDEEVVVVVAN